jgi:hypothetical protein
MPDSIAALERRCAEPRVLVVHQSIERPADSAFWSAWNLRDRSVSGE